MRSIKYAAFVAAMSLGLGLTVASASAQQVANVETCLSSASQVKTALASNAQSANYEAAMKERNYGLAYCNSGFYEKGVSHYSRALQILGMAQNGDAAH